MSIAAPAIKWENGGKFAQFHKCTDSVSSCFCQDSRAGGESVSAVRLILCPRRYSWHPADGEYQLKLRHVILGSVGWLTASVAGVVVLRSELSQQSSSLSSLATDVSHWVAGQKTELTGHCTFPVGIALDDPVFFETEDGRFCQAGHVSSVDGTRFRDPLVTSQVQIVLYDDAIHQFPEGWHLEYFTTPMSLEWVITMMIPPERQQEIAELIRQEWKVHQQDVMDELRPVMREGVRWAMRAVEADLSSIIQRHRADFRGLGDRFETEILQEELLPLIRDEIFPVIQEEAQPLAMDIGRSLWQRISLWSFTWRYLYDVSPLPERNAVQSEFQRYINNEALPELESRTEDFIALTRTIIRRVMQNPAVKESLRENLRRITEDAELQQIVWAILRESTFENERLRRELEAYWKSQETRVAVRMASARIEPTVRGIGDLIFGTREKGITAEFSRILRSQILQKDRRWFVMVPDAGTPFTGEEVVITLAEHPMLYPLKFSGSRQSPLTQTDISVSE